MKVAIARVKINREQNLVSSVPKKSRGMATLELSFKFSLVQIFYKHEKT